MHKKQEDKVFFIKLMITRNYCSSQEQLRDLMIDLILRILSLQAKIKRKRKEISYRIVKLTRPLLEILWLLKQGSTLETFKME